MAVALFALSVVLGAQLFRVLFPLAFDLSETTGSINAGLLTMAVFALAPLLAAPARRLLGPRAALVLALGGAVAARAAIQLVRPVPLWLAAAGTALALAAWALLAHDLRRDGRAGSAPFVLGLVLGMAFDTALRAAFWSWDYAWRDGVVPLALTLILGAAVVALLAAGAPGGAGPGEARVGRALPLVLLGPFLLLQLLFLQSVAFVASSSGLSLPAAAALVLVGDALAVAAVLWVGSGAPGPGAVGVAGATLVVAAVLLRKVEGPATAVAILAGHPLAAGLLALGLARERPGAAAWRTSAGMAGGLLLFLGLAFAYQVHYDIPLPFPNAVLPPAAAVLLGAPIAFGRRAGAGRRAASWRLAAAPLALLVVPLALALGRDSEVRTGDGASLRLVDYNLHMGVNTEGQVDPEAIARVIEAQSPDVVVLQEVPRGWVTNGMTDLAEWMSARLGMPYVYGGAADGQFGNAILSRLPIAEGRTGLLGQFEGTMDRGYVWAVIDLGGGEKVNVIDTHLQHREQDTPIRLKQIAALLDAWGGAERTVIAGDMNDYPESEEFAAFVEAGFLSAQDEAGRGDLPTSWQDGTRIDYIFATPDLALSDFARPFSKASDHLALAVTVSVS